MSNWLMKYYESYGHIKNWVKWGYFDKFIARLLFELESWFFFKLKLNHELCLTDHISRHLSLIVFLENRSEYFALLSPVHMVHIRLSFFFFFLKLDNGLGKHIIDFGIVLHSHYELRVLIPKYQTCKLKQNLGKVLNSKLFFLDAPKIS